MSTLTVRNHGNGTGANANVSLIGLGTNGAKVGNPLTAPDRKKEQALQSLQAAPPSHVALDATELEPNDDILHTNLIELGKLVRAANSTQKDSDLYTFTTPAIYRDWIRVEPQNLSTTLEFNLELFDATKNSLGSTHNTTPGGDLSYDFVAQPSSTFTVRVSNYYGQSTGVYLIRVAAEKAYDAYDPKYDILSANSAG
jgi:hypothetical protein